MSTNPKIQILFTGGTIDSYWDGKLDTAVVKTFSSIPEYLKTLVLYGRFDFKQICMKDSRRLTPKDLRNIVKAVEQSKYQKIIITHGTYTMPDSAKYLKANLRRHDQTVVFTGSMIPLKGFESSDAPYNLGYAIAKADDLPPGIHIGMNGRE
jgi:L-asparaginase